MLIVLKCLLNAASLSGLKPVHASRLREAYSHLYYSATGLPPEFVTHATRSPSRTGTSPDPTSSSGFWSAAARKSLLLGGELQLRKDRLVHALASGLPDRDYPMDTPP